MGMQNDRHAGRPTAVRAGTARSRTGGGAIEAGLRGAFDSLTFDTGDEIIAALDTVAGRDGSKSVWQHGFAEAFKHNKRHQDELRELDKRDHSQARATGEILGGAAGGMLFPGLGAGRVGLAAAKAALRRGVGKTAARWIGRTAGAGSFVGTNAVQGVVEAVGSGNGSFSERWDGAPRGAIAGPLVALATIPVVGASKRLLSPVVDNAVRRLDKFGVAMTPDRIKLGRRAQDLAHDVVGETFEFFIKDPVNDGLAELQKLAAEGRLTPAHVADMAAARASRAVDDATAPVRAAAATAARDLKDQATHLSNRAGEVRDQVVERAVDVGEAARRSSDQAAAVLHDAVDEGRTQLARAEATARRAGGKAREVGDRMQAVATDVVRRAEKTSREMYRHGKREVADQADKLKGWVDDAVDWATEDRRRAPAAPPPRPGAARGQALRPNHRLDPRAKALMDFYQRQRRAAVDALPPQVRRFLDAIG